MQLELLTDTTHSNAVVDYKGDYFLFGQGVNIVLSDNPGLNSIFGCPAIRVGYRKRPFNEAEKMHQKRYNEGKPYKWDNRLLAVYQVDWTQFKGDLIPGTCLQEGVCISFGGLSDASIAKFAVDVEGNQVVSYIHTSYWIEDRHDIPRWRKFLFQKYPKL